MKTTVKVIMLCCVVLGTIILALHYFQKSSPVSVVLSGTPGTKVRGAYVTDGELKLYSVQLPATLKFQSKYDFSVVAEKENSEDEFVFSVETAVGFSERIVADNTCKGVTVRFDSYINRFIACGSGNRILVK